MGAGVGARVNSTRALVTVSRGKWRHVCQDWAVGTAPGRALQGRFEALGGFRGGSQGASPEAGGQRGSITKGLV